MTMTENDDLLDGLEVVMGWSGVVLPVGVRAGEMDNRTFLDPSWPPLPITLADNHWGEEFIGPIDQMELISREDATARLGLTPDEAAYLGDTNVWASGRFADTDEAVKVAGQLAFWGRLPVSIEVRDGDVVETIVEDPDVMIDPEVEEDWGTPIEIEVTFTRTVIGAVAIERLPAFAGAWIRPDAEAAAFVPTDAEPVEAPEGDEADLVAQVTAMAEALDRPVARTAGVGPITYPAAHFARPEDGFAYAEQTRLTIGPDGEVTGHVLPQGARSRTSRDDSWVAARNPNDDLSEWLVGAARLDDGRTVLAGVIVSDGLHGPAHERGASGDRMRELIESTAHQVAQVTAWWDEHGLAVHGSTLPGVRPEQATRAMAGCPSVDERWFDSRGWMTTGVLCVNTCRFSPGQAVMRVASGAPTHRVVAASTACGCGGGAGASGGACSCSAVRSASGDESEPTEAPTRPAGRLAEIDRSFERERLRNAAQAVKPKG